MLFRSRGHRRCRRRWRPRATRGARHATTKQYWDITTTARHLGVSTHTLRYYERIGLVRVGRGGSGHRRYDAAAVRRLVFLTRMRTSGMPIRDLRRYVELVEAGRNTVPERLAMLTQ